MRKIKNTVMCLLCTAACFTLVMSCNGPQSITIKGKPEVRIPMGSPFSSLKPEDRLENQIDPERIKKMMCDDENDISETYDYKNSAYVAGKTQAYIMHYTIVSHWEIGDLGQIPPNLLVGADYTFFKTYLIQNNFRNSLGKNVTFKKITGYIYMDGIVSGATMTIKTGHALDSSQKITGPASIKIDDQPLRTETFIVPAAGEIYTRNLLPHSLSEMSDDNTIDFTQDFKEDVDEFYIEYALTVPISGNISKTISAHMVILIPLEFDVDEPSSKAGYVKLDMGAAFPEPGTDDLFGRDSSDDGVLSSIKSVRFIISKFNNTIISSDLFLYVASAPTNKEYGTIDFRQKEPSLGINLKSEFPFIPKFEMLLKKDVGKDTGTLSLERREPGVKAKFDFSLTVEAKTDIYQTTDLSEK